MKVVSLNWRTEFYKEIIRKKIHEKAAHEGALAVISLQMQDPVRHPAIPCNGAHFCYRARRSVLMPELLSPIPLMSNQNPSVSQG